MKRFVWFLVFAIILAIPSRTFAEAVLSPSMPTSWPSDSAYCMEVVNCEEWVSLREEPSTSAKVVTTIPLGSHVYHCRKVTDEFTYCESDYADAEKGYILSKYLKAPPFYVRQAGEPSEGTEILDEVADFSFADHEDVWKIDSWHSNRILCATGLYYDEDKLYLSCFDDEQKFKWGLYSDTGSIGGEITGVVAFAGGTSERPLVYVYNTSLGLVALDEETGEAVWTVDQVDVDLGTGGAHAVDWSDGTLYIGGEYDVDPVAISIDGEVLWQSEAGDDAVWLSEIIIEGDELFALYDGPDGEGCNVILDRETGKLLSSEPVQLY